VLVSRLDKLLEIRLFYRIRLVQAQIVQVRFLPSHRGLKEMRGMMKDLIKSIEGIVKKEMSEFWNISEETKKVCLQIAASIAQSIVVDEKAIEECLMKQGIIAKTPKELAKAIFEWDILKVVE